MSALMLLALAGMGVVAGLLAGLLGVGGGLVLVPVLVWVMEGSGMHAHVQHMALGTSLAVMVFTSFLRCAPIIGTARWIDDCAPLAPPLCWARCWARSWPGCCQP